MKTNRLLSFSILAIVWIQVFTPSKILAHRNCESYLDCHQTPETLEKVDYWTNYFFKLLRPEMRNKRIRIYHTLYRRERAEIRRVVNKVVYQSCQQPHINHYYLLSERERELENRDRWQRFNRRNRTNRLSSDRYHNWEQYDYYGDELLWDEELWEEGYYWERTENYFFEGLYRDLTDAVFYARHPELSREISRKENLNWSTEWTFIRQHFANFEEEKFLKQHLIPLCDRYKY
ncbi:MAG: hypothetical protein QNJ32_05705 [Xenococcaceae cyanobacterium MO_167.B27]|nr:hypothetical protein [Xenococcaceae cyanobacterium MO_167.B27]